MADKTTFSASEIKAMMELVEKDVEKLCEMGLVCEVGDGWLFL